MKGRGKREIPEEPRRSAATSGTIPTCVNPEWTIDRSRWLRTTNLRVPTLNCFSASRSCENGMVLMSVGQNVVRGLCSCTSKVENRGSDTGDTNTHAQRPIAPTLKAMREGLEQFLALNGRRWVHRAVLRLPRVAHSPRRPPSLARIPGPLSSTHSYWYVATHSCPPIDWRGRSYSRQPLDILRFSTVDRRPRLSRAHRVAGVAIITRRLASPDFCCGCHEHRTHDGLLTKTTTTVGPSVSGEDDGSVADTWDDAGTARPAAADTSDGPAVDFPEAENSPSIEVPEATSVETRKICEFSDLQARLNSRMYKYADINCILVVCCHSGRRRLGQRSPGGHDKRKTTFYLCNACVIGAVFIRHAPGNSAPVNERSTTVCPNHGQFAPKGSDLTSRQQPMEKRRRLEYIQYSPGNLTRRRESQPIGESFAAHGSQSETRLHPLALLSQSANAGAHIKETAIPTKTRHLYSSHCDMSNTFAEMPDHDGNTARLARRGDEALGTRAHVARIAPFASRPWTRRFALLVRRYCAMPDSVKARARSAIAACIRASVAPVMAFPALHGQISYQVPCPHSSRVEWPTCSRRVAGSRLGASNVADAQLDCRTGNSSTRRSH
ncbi:hypothetical protein PR048_033252 [Dryococelus australis]|uniref:Uncharacterized protein n=1 Tax=Dryococelus australis TaxID=614101 RepID=A0ABQ9FZS2_9NEOP|nr:hypothetical protein PR048_033252 [Dryococelus australis]